MRRRGFWAMPTTELQTECSREESINSFLANRLDSASRQAFVAHLGVCEHCASLLRELRRDERLARIPLTAEETSRIRAIAREARDEVTVRLEQDRRERARSAGAPRFEPPCLALVTPSLPRVFWFSAAAAAVLAALASMAWLLGQ